VYGRVAQGAVAEIPTDKLPVVFGMFMYETAAEITDMEVAHMLADV